MAPTIEDIASVAARSPAQVTRRDIVRGLLSCPAADALAALPGLRRELLAAGNPMSAAFWDGAAATLSGIERGAATVGDVRAWLKATGTEPAQLLGGFLWPDEDERGPRTAEMHDLLVAHLEQQVAAGVVDPDRLLAGDDDTLAA